MEVRFINTIFTHYGNFYAGKKYVLEQWQYDHLSELNPNDIELVIPDVD